MHGDPLAVLEMGSQSLKLHVIRKSPKGEHAVESIKFPWRVAHDIFNLGRIEESTISEMVSAIREAAAAAEGIPPSRLMAVATGVFRELPGLEQIAARVSGETGIRVRVISGQDEARLMARAFVREAKAGSFLIVDLGGATTQWAWIEDGTIRALGSLPLGAIRNEYRFRQLKDEPQEYLRQASRYCDDRLGEVPADRSMSLLVTGGTARAAGLWAGTNRISSEVLGALVARVAWHGPPPFLRPERAGVLLAGLVILQSVLRRSRAEHIEIAETSVGEGLAQRLVKLVGSRSREDIHATLLLHTSDTGKIVR